VAIFVWSTVMDKKDYPKGAISDIGYLKHHLYHKRDKPLWLAPGWSLYTAKGGLALLTAGNATAIPIVKLIFDKNSYFRKSHVHQVNTNIDGLYFDYIRFLNKPFRVVEGYGRVHWSLSMRDDKKHFLFDNYFFAYAYGHKEQP
jgi:hypothetical protein